MNSISGLDFLNEIFSRDGMKEESTIKLFEENQDNNAYTTYQNLGNLLLILYRLSTCSYDGCRKADHRIEYMTGKAYNNALASLKLIRLGFYDESLTLVRSITEIINLLLLFWLDPVSYEDWLKTPEKKRFIKYGPGKVREKISSLGHNPMISKAYYSKLCEVGVHVNPDTKPSEYNKHGIPTVGGIIQKHAPIALLNDLCNSVFLIVLISGRCILKPEKFTELADELNRYVMNDANVTIMNFKEYIKQKEKI